MNILRKFFTIELVLSNILNKKYKKKALGKFIEREINKIQLLFQQHTIKLIDFNHIQLNEFG